MKYRKLFSRLKNIRTSGLTPEGICFNALLNKFIKINSSVDSYLINMSDGEPYFNKTLSQGGRQFQYYGSFATSHTAKQWKKY